MTYRTVLKKGDLNPDGVHIIVNWAEMGVNMSVFIPCLNTEEATRQVQKVFADNGWQLETRVTIEDNKLGVRVWRTL